MFTALVPMRAGSERVQGKNLVDLGGRPLCAWILTTLSRVSGVTQVVVDTDSDQIEAVVLSLDLGVRVIRRPPHLGTAETPMNDVIAHLLDAIPEADLFLQTHATSPFLSASTLSTAIQRFLNGNAASVFSVTRIQSRVYTADGRPVNHDPSVLLPTQSLAPVFEENSSFYLFSRQSFVTRRNRVSEGAQMVEIPALDAVDIDTPEDLDLARRIAPSVGPEMLRRG